MNPSPMTNIQAPALQKWIGHLARTLQMWIGHPARSLQLWIGHLARSLQMWIGHLARSLQMWIGHPARSLQLWIGHPARTLQMWIGHPARSLRQLAASSSDTHNTIHIVYFDRKAGVPPVREDSASRLSANATAGWKPVVRASQDPLSSITAAPPVPRCVALGSII